MKKFQALLLLPIFLIGLALPLKTEAASLTCPGDYYSFISDVRSEKLRDETIKDIFTLSYCQLLDIVYLDDQLDLLRDNFREAAFACEDTTDYKRDYTKILLEMHYIRQLQPYPAGTLREAEAEELESLKDERIAKIEKEMSDLFVIQEAKLSQGQMNEYFIEWKARYEDKILDYANCQDGPWAEVNESVQDFQETMDSIFNEPLDVEKTPNKSFKEFFDFSADTELDTEDWSQVSRAMDGFFDKFKKTEEEKVEEALTVQEAAERSTRIDESFEVLAESERDFEVANFSAER
ncbi:MAG: hypothetical protein AAB802_02595, partial [Patescibacteria group bacterium]